jgi:copper-exporting ATPase
LPQVEKAEVSHETGKAVVTLKEAVADEVLKKAVEDQEYTVKSIS